MKLNEIAANKSAITVRVDQAFSDMSMEFDFDEDWEDISQLPEPVKPLVFVITPTDQDYRGQAGGSLKNDYANSPELGYYVGVKSGRLYSRDMLNEPQSVALLNITPDQLMKLVQAHVVNEPTHGNMN